jgi:hypothetical protein
MSYHLEQPFKGNKVKITRRQLSCIIKEELQRVISEQQQDTSMYRQYLEDLIPNALVPEESKERFFSDASELMSNECASLIDADGIKDEMKLKACAAKSMTLVASKLALVEVVQWIAVKLGNLVYGGLPHE